MLLKDCKLLGSDDKVDILIKDGKIVNIEKYISSDEKKIIDLKGKYVLPGLIDPHVHFRDPGMTHKEDFFTGSCAAAKGGYTTVIDMPNTNPSTTSKDLLDKKREIAKDSSVINYGFNFGVTNQNYNDINNIDNIASAKIFMGASTGNLLIDKDEDLKNVFSVINKIAMIHAEDEDMINVNTKKYKDKNDPYIHWQIRSNEAARKAVERAINIAKPFNRSIYICHTSTKQELELIKKAKQEGQLVYCEVSPHHLFLDNSYLKTKKNYAKMNPPLRSKEDVDFLWQSINDGTVDTIGTDHAPHLKEEKEKDYWNAPSGVPGSENALALMLNAVNEGKISLNKVTQLMSTNPAKIFNIKNKGQIKVGNDADFCVIEMDLIKEVKDEDQITKCRWSPYSGIKLKGWPVMTIVNGNIVYDDGNINKDTKGKEIEIKKGDR